MKDGVYGFILDNGEQSRQAKKALALHVSNVVLHGHVLISYLGSMESCYAMCSSSQSPHPLHDSYPHVHAAEGRSTHSE